MSSERTIYPPRVQLPDNRGRRRDRSLGREWVQLPVGDVSPNPTLENVGTHTFTVYATGGVLIPGTTGAVDVLMAPWTDGAGTVFLFKWNPGTSRMMVTSWNGEELGAAEDISAIADHPYRVVLEDGLRPRSIARLSGSGRILAVEFEVTTSLTGDDTDYWTLSAFLRRVDFSSPQTIGEPLGSYDSSRVTWNAYEDLPIYSDEQGTVFHDSDRLMIRAAASGSPPALHGCSAWAQIQREVF